MFDCDTLGVHVVNHPIATALMHGLKSPLVATSANTSGFLSPTSAADVLAAFPQEEELLVLDGGDTFFGIESTIIDLTHNDVRVLRYGAISCVEIKKCLGEPVILPELFSDVAAEESQTLTLRLNAQAPYPEEAFLAFGPVEHKDLSCVAFLNLSYSGDLKEAACRLFSMLRQLKASGARTIAVMPIPSHGSGAAINERLVKFHQKLVI
jgi:L-threonylcarbamoyladenylate synthase